MGRLPFRGSGGRDRDQSLQLQERLLADSLHIHQLLDLISEDDRTNVHAGEREVRPPAAPTGRDWLSRNDGQIARLVRRMAP
jgi:hypothetical protein